MRRRAAERAGAPVAVLDGLGHWWMLQDPARGAAVLTEFWALRLRDSDDAHPQSAPFDVRRTRRGTSR